SLSVSLEIFPVWHRPKQPGLCLRKRKNLISESSATRAKTQNLCLAQGAGYGTIPANAGLVATRRRIHRNLAHVQEDGTEGLWENHPQFQTESGQYGFVMATQEVSDSLRTRAGILSWNSFHT